MQTLYTTTTTTTTFHLSRPNPNPSPLSSSNSISSLSLLPKLSTLSLTTPSTLIRMGGGPRTYPGGVSKWQWKRMQAKKAKQLLKARLARERQIYEMRKRAELKAAVSNLERPWEVVRNDRGVSNNSTLFSVSADEQLKVLADRFQKPGGFDLWSENDGPQLFHTPEGLPSSRFFPKGIVHSVKPYAKTDGLDKRGNRLKGGDENGMLEGRKKGGKGSRSDKMKGNEIRGRNSGRMTRNFDGEKDDVYDLSLQGDGSYGFNGRNEG